MANGWTGKIQRRTNVATKPFAENDEASFDGHFQWTAFDTASMRFMGSAEELIPPPKRLY